jgi:hypothetical protein
MWRSSRFPKGTPHSSIRPKDSVYHEGATAKRRPAALRLDGINGYCHHEAWPAPNSQPPALPGSV